MSVGRWLEVLLCNRAKQSDINILYIKILLILDIWRIKKHSQTAEIK